LANSCSTGSSGRENARKTPWVPLLTNKAWVLVISSSLETKVSFPAGCISAIGSIEISWLIKTASDLFPLVNSFIVCPDTIRTLPVMKSKARHNFIVTVTPFPVAKGKSKIEYVTGRINTYIYVKYSWRI